MGKPPTLFTVPAVLHVRACIFASRDGHLIDLMMRNRFDVVRKGEFKVVEMNNKRTIIIKLYEMQGSV